MCSKPRGKLSRPVHHKRNLITGMCEMFADERRGAARLARKCSVQLEKSISQPTIPVYATNRSARRYAQQLRRDQTRRRITTVGGIIACRIVQPLTIGKCARGVLIESRTSITDRLGLSIRKPRNFECRLTRCHGNPRE